MEWTTPTWAEIKMDAEIGSYQEDYEPERDRFLVRLDRAASTDAAVRAPTVAAR